MTLRRSHPQNRDEYGDIPGQGGTQYATMDTVLPDKDLHVQGTVRESGTRLTFWLTTSRPGGMTVEEWDALRQARWERAFRVGASVQEELMDMVTEQAQLANTTLFADIKRVLDRVLDRGETFDMRAEKILNLIRNAPQLVPCTQHQVAQFFALSDNASLVRGIVESIKNQIEHRRSLAEWRATRAIIRERAA